MRESVTNDMIGNI